MEKSAQSEGSSIPAGSRGRFWDDYSIGEEFYSTGRTITEHDIAAFAALSGDFNPLHLDAQLGKASIFGERVPHGPLGLVLSLGGYDRIGIMEGVAVAFLGITWGFHKPLLIGDTVRTKVTIAELRPTKNEQRGIVVLRVELCNQRDEVVQGGNHTFLILRRSPA